MRHGVANGIHAYCTTYSRRDGVCRPVTCARRTPDRPGAGGAAPGGAARAAPRRAPPPAGRRRPPFGAPDPPPQAGGVGSPAGAVHQPVDVVVEVRRVVVEQGQVAGSGLGGHVHGVADRRMAPVGPGGELLVGEDALPVQLAELLHCVAVHHDARGARSAEAAVLYHANQLDAVAATRKVD